MDAKKKLMLAFYGDDFTGSTDALEFLSRAGVRTRLFLDNPAPGKIDTMDNLDAIGIAGKTRAMVPAEMAETLQQAFSVLKKINPRHVHYKVCSTFDSSPAIGNIGTAIETSIRIFGNEFTPILVAAPHLGRYSAFGNLFARMGIGSAGAIYRLDRHPSMCSHPVTPAPESDLRLHLSRQTNLPMGLVDLVAMENPPEMIEKKLNEEITLGKKVIFFDAMYEHQMAAIGEVIDKKANGKSPLFSVGSSGIEKALGDFWEKEGIFKTQVHWEELAECKPMLVISGSVSPVTASQIEWAVANGFVNIPVEPESLNNDESAESYIEEYQRKIFESLRRGKSVILHTSLGPDDDRNKKIKSIFSQKGWSKQKIRTQTAKEFGRVLGQSARKALEQIPVKRLVIAGGDTSSYVARKLGIEAVEMITPLYPGAPVCRAFAKGSPVNGIEVNLKGGQMGDKTYFGALQKGKMIK